MELVLDMHGDRGMFRGISAYMGEHEYSISREVQIDLQGVSTGLNCALDCGEGIFGEFPLVAAVGDDLWETWEGMCWER
jgi:hypothetical protein